MTSIELDPGVVRTISSKVNAIIMFPGQQAAAERFCIGVLGLQTPSEIASWLI